MDINSRRVRRVAGDDGTPDPRNRERSVAVVFPFPGLSTVPSLVNGCQLLAKTGLHVTVYTIRDDRYPKPAFPADRVSIVDDLPSLFDFASVELPKLLHGRGGRIVGWLTRRLLRPLKRLTVTNRRLKGAHRRSPFLAIIGVDAEGLVDAARLARLLSVPLVYWSLELIFSDELETRADRRLKALELDASASASIVITQDTGRANALAAENGLDQGKVMLVPNSPLGPARRKPGRYVYERFGLEPARRVLISAGSLAEWSMSRELLEAASSWPPELALVLHSRYVADRDPYVGDLIADFAEGSAILSLVPLPSSEYGALLDSCDMGVALYKQIPSRYTRRNLELMGMSSGKLSAYLQRGLPVIVSNVAGPRDLVREYDCGVVVESADEVFEAALSILESYTRLSENAVRCFNERLRFEDRFGDLVTRLLALPTQDSKTARSSRP
jgi:glycosyltransferase involved in cell wall biosynthesis